MHNNSEQPMLDGFEPLEGVDTPRDLAAFAADIAATVHGRLVEAETTSSDRYYEELGGSRREDLMANHPPLVQPPRQPRRTGNVRDTEPSDSALDPYWNALPGKPLSAGERINANQTANEVRQAQAERTKQQLIAEYGEPQAKAIMRSRQERQGH